MRPNDLQLPDYAGNPLGRMTDELAEQQMICSLCEYPGTLTQADDILTEDCFFNPKNRLLFSIISKRILEYKPVDISALHSALLKEQKGDISAYYATLMISNRPTSVIREIAVHLASLNLRRCMYVNAEYLREGMIDTTQDIDAVIEESKRRINDAYSLPDNNLENGQEIYERLQQHIILNQDRAPGEVYGTPTGFEEIDKAGGLCPGDLNIVGAETSQGKTSFATALALSSIAHGHAVAFYSMEMMPIHVMARVAAMRSGISSSQMISGVVKMPGLHHMDHSVEDLDLSLLHFDSKSKCTIDSILMSIRRLTVKEGIKGVVVDYLQLIGVSDSRLNREQATAQCARALKNLAKELGIWVILISQMSRSVSASGAPMMARLRDSGQIEEAADNVYLIYRPAQGVRYPAPYTDVSTQGTAMVIIAKGRNSGTGSFICGFEPDLTLFYPLNGADPRFAHPPVAPYESYTF